MKKIGSLNRVLFLTICILSTYVSVAMADVSIETSVSRSRLSLGDTLTLDIVVSGASGKIQKPKIASLDGFSSYSQGHSQEIEIVNGRMSSRSVFSYSLTANAQGQKTIGPFEIDIDGKIFKAPAIKVDVVMSGASSPAAPSASMSGVPVSTPHPRAVPTSKEASDDIFVKVWLDKDEAYVNEPVMMTYTMYTRLPTTYKGFDKEPVTTGFWIEDFPPEKTIKRTEQIIGGRRYVVADVRKISLFGTKEGTFTIDPGTLSALVETQNEQAFNQFYSSNIFGTRFPGMQSAFSQTVEKKILTEPIRYKVKALPLEGKPAFFSGAVGDYDMQVTLDKLKAELGDPLTLRVRISGQGNINTIQCPVISDLPDFKVYDSSESSNLSKENLVVEGEKVVDTVIVPKKAGQLIVPSVKFAYFDLKTNQYKILAGPQYKVEVKQGAGGGSIDETAQTSKILNAAASSADAVDKARVETLATDIRYIKDKSKYQTSVIWHGLSSNRRIWILMFLLLPFSWLVLFLAELRRASLEDVSGNRMRQSHRVARQKLRTTHKYLKQNKAKEFHNELSRAVRGYFADKLNQSSSALTADSIELALGDKASTKLIQEIRQFFEQVSRGQYGTHDNDAQSMKELYKQADELITDFERIKL